MTANPSPPSLFDRRLWTILIIVFFQMLSGSLILPILPLYAQDRFSLSPQIVTLLFASFFIAQFIAGPYLGRLSDRYGRVPVLIFSQIGTAISFIMIAQARSVEALFLARILDGITGGNIIVAQAYVTDITPRSERTRALGFIFAAFGLGFIFGPTAGGGLSAVFGPQAPFWVAAVGSIVVVILTWWMLDESLTAEQRALNRRSPAGRLSLKAIAGNLPLALVLIIAFVGQFGLGMLQATFALYGKAVLFADVNPRLTNLGVGLLFTVIGLSQFATQTLLLPRVVRRYSEPLIAMLGIVSRTVGFLIFALATSPWIAAFGSLFFACGMGLLMPPLQALSTRLAPDEMRGGILGVFQSAVSLATIFGTVMGGFLFASGPTWPHWVGAGLTVILLLPASMLRRQTRHLATIPAN